MTALKVILYVKPFHTMALQACRRRVSAGEGGHWRYRTEAHDEVSLTRSLAESEGVSYSLTPEVEGSGISSLHL
jgi:hypothetical protein